MSKAILREKSIMKVLTENVSPFIIQLFATFQDETRLYFALNYCVNGELLSFINQQEVFDEEAALFYMAEILLALEHLHRLGIVHRDLKPENILLTEKLHIQITDFGSAINLNDPNQEIEDKNMFNNLNSYRNRKNSFVGTAQYVSPEMLTNKKITPMADIWAYACILYQMLTSKPPFVSGNEYMIFQKIQNLEYTFPDDFPSDAKHLIQSILKIKSTERLGANDDLQKGGYESIRSHPYFAPLNGDWDMLNKLPPEKIQAVAKMDNTSDLTTELTEKGLGEKQITRLLGLHLHDDSDENLIKPNRTYILEDTANSAPLWIAAVDEVKNFYFSDDSSPESSPQPSTCSNGDSELKNGRKSTKQGLFHLQIRKIGMTEKTN
ncbi:PREDICTED: putative 3-phosphoinositide-dependent protein kinase 2 [Rhagoletis zephyria]|uniref:putative 3-phosphoinositide-dependent protein kinase 2 n=1 Tax=Rhagoletis zephyria TaxID=28612 RepID=UPI0008116087|nr:PREDICTED: putative 3-phosphoinositide-dependent protein kinase 2 [Rhagoletis zephyria]